MLSVYYTLCTTSFGFFSPFVCTCRFIWPSSGVRIGLFTPDKAFDLVCRDQIRKLKEPGNKLVDLVVQEIMKIFKDMLSKVTSVRGELFQAFLKTLFT